MQNRDPIEMVNDYIRRFGEAVSVELHPLDADGYTDLRHGSVIIGINAYVDRNVLLILARMGQIPELDNVVLYRKLLELNFLATRSCCFAIDDRRKRLYLRAMRGLDGLDYEEFAELLETVAAVAIKLRTHLPELTD
jgi:Tir chaperone protein (CesT) family